VKLQFVDTNIFLRYLLRDDPAQYERCARLFRLAIAGEVSLLTSHVVIAELVWTLLSHFKVPKALLVEKLGVLVQAECLVIPDKPVVAEALALYGRKNIDFVDAYNAVYLRVAGCTEIISYDRDFDRLDWVRRREP